MKKKLTFAGANKLLDVHNIPESLDDDVRGQLEDVIQRGVLGKRSYSIQFIR
jgi:hypothetical protein